MPINKKADIYTAKRNMLTPPHLGSGVDALWDRFWPGGVVLPEVVQEASLLGKRVRHADLYEEPFTNLGAIAVEKLFAGRGIFKMIFLRDLGF